MDGRIKVAVEAAAGNYPTIISGTVKFELVDAIFVDHFKTSISKTLVVLWAGQRKAAIYNFESSLLAELDPLLLGLS